MFQKLCVELWFVCPKSSFSSHIHTSLLRYLIQSLRTRVWWFILDVHKYFDPQVCSNIPISLSQGPHRVSKLPVFVLKCHTMQHVSESPIHIHIQVIFLFNHTSKSGCFHCCVFVSLCFERRRVISFLWFRFKESSCIVWFFPFIGHSCIAPFSFSFFVHLCCCWSIQ